MKSITIRDVPDDTHAELTARAAAAGQSLQEYLKAKLVEEAARADMKAWMARIDARARRRPAALCPSKRLLRIGTRIAGEVGR